MLRYINCPVDKGLIIYSILRQPLIKPFNSTENAANHQGTCPTPELHVALTDASVNTHCEVVSKQKM